MLTKITTGTRFINHGSAAWIREIWMRDRIYNYMWGYWYKTRYRIQEKWGTDTKQGTGFKKNEVPIQNKVPDSWKMRYWYKTRYRIQEKWGTDTKQGTGFKKNEVPIQKRGIRFKKKLRYRYKTRYRIQENSRYRYQNGDTDTVPHKEKCSTTQVKLKGRNRHQNKKNSECRFCENYH